MRLSTSTNIMDRYQRVQNAVSMEDCLRRCQKAGYRVMDMNFCDMSNPGMPLALPDWEAWTARIGRLAQDLGLTFSQSHAHFYNFLAPDVPDRAFRDEMIRRSILASGMLGVPWMTMHAGTDAQSNGFSAKRSKEGNLRVLGPWVELALRQGVGVCLENMFDPTPTQRTYTASTDDLLDLVDSFADPRVAVCWDFGHAHLAGMDQCESLRQVGQRLKSTHFSDNHGQRDEHLLPFYGDIDWEPILQTLKEIGFDLDVTFEITPFLDRVPPTLRDTALRHTVEVGEYLVRRILEA